MTPDIATVICLLGFAALGIIDAILTRGTRKQILDLHHRIDRITSFLVLDKDEAAP